MATSILSTAEKTTEARFGAQSHGDACYERDERKCETMFDVQTGFAAPKSSTMVAIAKPAEKKPSASVPLTELPAAQAAQAAIDRTPAKATKMHVTGKHIDPVTAKATACEGFLVNQTDGTVTAFRCPAKKNGTCPAKINSSCILETPVAIPRK